MHTVDAHNIHHRHSTSSHATQKTPHTPHIQHPHPMCAMIQNRYTRFKCTAHTNSTTHMYNHTQHSYPENIYTIHIRCIKVYIYIYIHHPYLIVTKHIHTTHTHTNTSIHHTLSLHTKPIAHSQNCHTTHTHKRLRCTTPTIRSYAKHTHTHTTHKMHTPEDPVGPVWTGDRQKVPGPHPVSSCTSRKSDQALHHIPKPESCGECQPGGPDLPDQP